MEPKFLWKFPALVISNYIIFPALKKGEVEKFGKRCELLELEFGMHTGTHRIKTIFDFLFKKIDLDRASASENLHKIFAFAENF
jgi:hypothetical protein